MSFASGGASRKARQRAGILREAIPLCRNAAAIPLPAHTLRVKADIKRGAALSSRAKARGHWLLDWVRGLTATCTTAWLGASAADSDTRFISKMRPRPLTRQTDQKAGRVRPALVIRHIIKYSQ